MPDSPQLRIYHAHILSAAGRVFIFACSATSPDDALDRLMRLGDYLPNHNDRLLVIKPGGELLHVPRDDA